MARPDTTNVMKLMIEALPQGGYVVSQPTRDDNLTIVRGLIAFSDLQESLDYVRKTLFQVPIAVEPPAPPPARGPMKSSSIRSKRGNKMKAPPAYMKPIPASPDQLFQIEQALSRVRDLKLEQAALEERLAWVKREIVFETQDNLPEMFHGARIMSLGLAKEGNKPAYMAELGPYYYANIAADWPQEKRNEAFDYLEKTGNGGLIKATVTVMVPAKAEAVRKKLFVFLEKEKLDFEPKLTVHHGTLKAWLQREVETHKRMPKLDLIGGTVGELVKVEPKED